MGPINIIARVCGLHKYIRSIQEINEHLASENESLANRNNKIAKEYLDYQKRTREIYNENHRYEQVIAELAKREEHAKQRIEELEKDNHDFNAQCAKFTSELQSLRAKLGAAKRKLAKYEQTQGNSNS